MSSSNLPQAIVGEMLRGNLDLDPTLHDHTGRVEPRLAELLSYRQVAWEQANDDRARFCESARFSEAVPIQNTARITQAIQSGNEGLIGLITGVVENDLDARTAQQLARMFGYVRHAGALLNFCGGTDNGKTNVVWLCAEVFSEIVEDALVLGNVDPATIELVDHMEYQLVRSIDEFEEVLTKFRDRPKIAFIDDASIDHSHHAGNSKEVAERQGKAARLAAKNDARILYVGHRDDGKDLSKHVRALPGVRHLLCARVLDEHGAIESYQATVYDELDEDGLAKVHRVLKPLPQTAVGYDPDDVAYALFSE